MFVKDIGFILSCKIFNENLKIIKILSQNNGLLTGLYRFNSKKKKFNLEHVHFEWRIKDMNKLGFFKIESNYDNFNIKDDYFSSLFKASMCELIVLFVADKEYNLQLYSSMKDTLSFLDKNRKLSIFGKCKSYILWELNLLKNIGYGLDLTRCVLSGKKDGLKYISPKSGKAVNEAFAEPYKNKLLCLPEFLIDEKKKLIRKDLTSGLNLTNHFLLKAKQDLNITKEKRFIIRREILKKIQTID